MRREKVTIKDIAREAGVSPALVSFVMSNKNRGRKEYRVSEETAKHILEVAGAMNYRPNMSARALKQGRTNTIGVIVSDISNSFFAEFARDIENEAYRIGKTVIFGSTDEDPGKLGKIVNVLLDKGVDGLVVVPCQHSEGTVREIAVAGIPLVLVDRDIEGLDVPSVMLNNHKASTDMTSRLIAKGYHHIEMISYDLDVANIRDREQGFIDCMKSYGLENKARIHKISHQENRQQVDEIIRDARQRRVEAFIFATNTLAVRGMSAMFRGGFHIPQDFGIACFDYNSSFDIYDTDLVYARQPVELFAKEAFNNMMAQLAPGGGQMAGQRVVIDADIIDTGRDT